MQVSIMMGDAHTRTAEVKTVAELATLATKNKYSLGLFKKNHRTSANFEQTEAIGLDIDGGMSLDEAKRAFAGFKHAILPTRNHRKEKNGVIADRFRVILFLSTPITDADTYYATWFALKRQYPASDDACKDPSRMFFPSIEAASINEEGRLVEPVKPQPKKEETKAPAPSPGQRGKLGRDTLAFLEFGSAPGGRNNAVHKAARDFHQNLFTLEEATERIVAALERNGVIAKDFTRQEAVNSIKSAYAIAPKHDARLEEQAFNLLPVGDMLSLKVTREWVVSRLIPKAGLVLMAGPPKSGKSTLVRQMVRSICRGEEFLGHKCEKGSVLYFALEEQVEAMQEDFRRLGINEADDILVHVGSARGGKAFDKFAEIVRERRPSIVIVDTLFKLAQVQDTSSYAQVNPIMMRFQDIARDSGAAVLLVHHSNKGNGDKERSPGDSILGSSAIRGGTDCNIVVEIHGRDRKISTEGRGVRWYLRRLLVFDEKAHFYTLGPETEEF